MISIKLNSHIPLNGAEVIFFEVLVQVVLEFNDEAQIVACYKSIIYIDYVNNYVSTDVSKVEIRTGMGFY